MIYSNELCEEWGGLFPPRGAAPDLYYLQICKICRYNKILYFYFDQTKYISYDKV